MMAYIMEPTTLVQVTGNEEVVFEREWKISAVGRTQVPWINLFNITPPEQGKLFIERHKLNFDKGHPILRVILTNEGTRAFKVLDTEGYLLPERLGDMKFGIPSYLLPETVAISVTSIVSVVGLIVSALLGTLSTLFLAPLIVSATGGLFLLRTIRKHD